jgi:FkbM family methyltransferase
VEPLPKNIELIDRAKARNGFQQIELIQGFASDADGQIELRTHANTAHSAPLETAGRALRANDATAVRVRTFPCDSVVGDSVQLDVLRIQAAGWEPKVLRGLSATLARCRPLLVARYNPWALTRESSEVASVYLAALFDLYPHVGVLHRNGSYVRCSDPSHVDLLWLRIAVDAPGDEGVAIDLIASVMPIVD